VQTAAKHVGDPSPTGDHREACPPAVDEKLAAVAGGESIHASCPEDALPDLTTIDRERWAKALARFEAIKPALEAGPPYLKNFKKQAAETELGVATLYRYLERYLDSGDARSLCDRIVKTRQPRLDPKVLEIISDRFNNLFMKSQKLGISEICFDVRFACWKAGLPLPHRNTVRKHINKLKAALGGREFEKRRGNKKMADAKYTAHQGTFDNQFGPWSLIQIDHTVLDVMVVDDDQRKSIGRPYITVALDTFSRMIVGFYISLDPVGALSTGLCLYHAMLPKDEWLKDHGVPTTWPCMGKPAALHFDNGKEFLGKMVRRFCELHDIRIEHRPVGRPHYGGHIERVIRTLNSNLHKIPGSTFSNVRMRGEYDSEGMAIMTLHELGGHVTEWIAGTYHKRIHTGLGRTPQSVYEEAILGTPDSRGIGRRASWTDTQRLRLDLMPFEERTIQRNGVNIDKLVYIGDALAPYIGTKKADGVARRFLFLRDPRRINEVYFYAPDVKEYYTLKLRNPLRPSMSIWEWNELRRRLAETGKADADEDAIFESYERLKEREADAAAKTKAMRRQKARRLHHLRAVPAGEPAAEDAADDMSGEVEPLDDIRVW
jgi:putative transposase